MSYSKDFRQQILSHIDAGSTIDAMSKRFSVGTTTIKRWKNLRKMTGDILRPGRLAPLCYQGTMDKVRFNFWLINFLIPETKPGDILMMDNAAFHQSEETKTLIKNAGGELLFLPPYSPDLNPIEKCWANIKGFIKRSKHRFESLADAIDEAFKWDRFKIN